MPNDNTAIRKVTLPLRGTYTVSNTDQMNGNEYNAYITSKKISGKQAAINHVTYNNKDIHDNNNNDKIFIVKVMAILKMMVIIMVMVGVLMLVELVIVVTTTTLLLQLMISYHT